MRDMRLTQGFAVFIALITGALVVYSTVLGPSAVALMLPVAISTAWVVVLGSVAGRDLRSDRQRISELKREVDELRQAMQSQNTTMPPPVSL